MNQPDPNLRPNRRLHPLIATAAGCVIVASLAATAAITGVFPKASGNATGQTAAVTPPPPPPATQLAQNGAGPAPVVAPQAAAPAAPPPQYGPSARQYAEAAPPAALTATCSTCGTVTGISAVRHQGRATGIGAVGGAVVGGVVGNQFGGGIGRLGMTALGALGGGVAGNAVEKHLRSTSSYSVRVHMENGRTRYFRYRAAPPFHDGEHVRIEHGTLVAA